MQNQLVINVGAAPNDGQGDPIRTAFIKTNDNFANLFALPNASPPVTLAGTANDTPGMYAYDSQYFYYCFADYDGVSNIWAQVSQVNNSITGILNGKSNVNIAFANANITVGVANVSNVAVFNPQGIVLKGNVTAPSGNIGSLSANTIQGNISIAAPSIAGGNITLSGDSITGASSNVTINTSTSTAGNIILNGNIEVNGTGTALFQSQQVVVAGNTLVLSAGTLGNVAANGTGIYVGQTGSNAISSFRYLSANGGYWDTPSGMTAYGFYGAVANIRIITANNITGSNIYFTTLDGSNINSINLNSDNVFATSVQAAFISGNGAGLYDISVNGSNVIGTVPSANIVTNAIQTNITRVGNLSNLIVSNNITANNIFGTTFITAPYIGGNANVILQGTIGANSNSQPNITQVGNLVSLDVAGDINGGGNISIPGTLYAGNIYGNFGGFTALAEYVTKPNQSNITSLGNLVSLTINGNLNMPTSNISAFGIFGNVIGRSPGFPPFVATLLQGNLSATSNAQPNITRVGNLISLNVDGNVNFGTDPANTVVISGNSISTGNASTILNLGYNVVIPGNLQVLGNTTTVNSNTVAINDLTFVVANNASTATLANGAGLFVGPEPAHYAGLYYDSVSDTWNFDIPLNVAGNVSAAAFNWSNGSPLISSSGNLSAANIVASYGNFTGNVTAAYFVGVATSAEYADLAENYLADAQYVPGTVLSFGGPKEVTVSTQDGDTLVAGVVSSNPAYTMNSTLAGNFATPVALLGRVPTRVTGTVTRGAMMVSNGDGTARAEKNPTMGSVIGKALESFEGTTGVIEIVVGRL